MTSKWLSPILGSVLLFSLIAPSPAVAAPTGLHWRREAGPVVVTVYDQTRDESWGRALHKLIDEWNTGIAGVNYVYGLDAANDNCGNGRGPFTVVVCVRENSSPNNVGEAYVYPDGDGDHIAYATIWMDPRPYPARKHLACHELGHTFGLGHRGADEKSCMTNGPTKRPEHPDQKDFNTVTHLHSHIH